ncbi:hypothetical protein [Micromonospora profundi]
MRHATVRAWRRRTRPVEVCCGEQLGMLDRQLTLDPVGAPG